MSGDPARVTTAEFDDVVLAAAVPVLVDFTADWSEPCRRVTASLSLLAQAYEGRALLFRVDVDAEPELAGRYQVVTVPTVLVFSEGVPRTRFVGSRSLEDFRSALLDQLT